jgi:hypothetical protein
LSRTTSGSLAGRCPINTHRLLADPIQDGAPYRLRLVAALAAGRCHSLEPVAAALPNIQLRLRSEVLSRARTQLSRARLWTAA